MSAAVETWKPVIGYEGAYEVSDLGRVRSLSRTVSCNRGKRIAQGKVLKPTLVSGYPQVHLVNCGRSRKCHIHRLVLEAFVGPPPFPNAQGCHFPDPSGTNNVLENLRWGSALDNASDRGVHGNHMRGSRNGASKYCAGDLERVRDLHRIGCKQTQISDWLGIGQSHVSGIIAGQRRAFG